MHHAPRVPCLACRRPVGECYCSKIRAFSPWPRFCLLMHPEEAKRAIATGRMTHLCLENSVLLKGIDFSQHEDVQKLLADPTLAPMLLYPGEDSIDLSTIPPDYRAAFLPPGKRPLVFVLDGTWRTVRAILRNSPNLRTLPSIRVTPHKLSEFIVRRQPHPNCLSTIEAVHTTIELLSPPDPERRHDNLLEVFQYMVNRQLEYRRRGRAELFAPFIPIPPLWGNEQMVN